MSEACRWRTSGEAAAAALALVRERFPHEERVERRAERWLDTFDWRLYRAGRLLADDGHALALRSLEGRETRWGRRTREPSFADSLPRSFRAEVGGAIGVRRLLVRAEVVVSDRQVAVLDREEKTVARVAVEEVVAGSPSGEVKAEAGVWLAARPVRGYGVAFRSVVDVVSDVPGLVADGAYAEGVFRAAGVEPGDYSSKVGFLLDPTRRADEALRGILVELLDVMLANEPGVRRDLDSEFLHDFRVAVRRSRSALSQIKGVLPPELVAWGRQELSWLGQLTGPTRDSDVYQLKMGAYREQLPPSVRDDLGPLEAYLRRHHEQVHAQLVEGLDSARYRELVRVWRRRLEEAVIDGRAPNGARPILEVASKRIWRAWRRVHERGRAIDSHTPAAALHRLRIDCKKLRYLLEFFRSLYDRKAVGRLVKSLKGLQDNLGDFNDYEVQQRQLVHFAEAMAAEGEAPVSTLLALGRLLAQLGEGQARERERFQALAETFLAKSNRRRFAALFRPATS